MIESYGEFSNIDIGGNTSHATIRRLLTELRGDKSIAFLDNRGAYVLNGVEILKGEVEEKSIQLIYDTSTSIEKEYLIETYARNRGRVKQAKEILGLACLYPKCTNIFFKENGVPYIEVHHIIPLYMGGDDGIWNLAVICAHHLRMAHYADVKTRLGFEKLLLRKTECRI